MVKIINLALKFLTVIVLLGSQTVSAATINETFTVSRQCNNIVNIRAQTGVTQQQLITSCNEITATDAAFHSFFNTTASGSVLPNDNNSTLDVYVYLSKADYVANAGTQFGISTNNGGMYLEGTPSNPSNQAKFIAHICEPGWIPFSCAYQGQVYNLKHEYVHYLDGRFNVAGPFGTFTYNAALTEGIAEYIAFGDSHSRTISSVKDKVIPPFYNIISASYEQPSLYEWAYLVIRYMQSNHRSEYDLIIDALRAGNVQSFQDTLKSVAGRIGNGFTPYVTSLTEAVAPTYVAMPADNNFGSCDLEQAYIRYLDEPATRSISVTNNSDVPVRILWISNVTGEAGTSEIARLEQGQNYANNYWRKTDRFAVVTDNKECLGVGVVGQTATFSIGQNMVNHIIPDPIPAANEIGSCVLNRAYFRPANAGTASISISNSTNTPARLYWVNTDTGALGGSEYARLLYGQNYSNTNWTEGDRMVLLNDNNECLGVALLRAGTNTFTITESGNQAPFADINGPYSGTANSSINFSSYGSADSDGTITSYYWNFGDGFTSYSTNPNHTYSTAGNYTVSLTVTDNDGETATAYSTATITTDSGGNSGSVPNACATESAITGGSLVADDASCLGNSSVIWLSIPNVNGHNSITISTGNGSGNLSLEYSNIGWPNGSNNDGTSTNAGNAECIHVTGGSNYWGNIKVSNSTGGASILVEFDTAGCGQSNGGNNQSPTANMNGPYTGTANSAVNFSSNGSADSDGTIASYSWNFGDGSTSTSANPSHTYSAAGNYTVSLTVVDNQNASTTVTTTATITQASGGSTLPDACATESAITSGTLVAGDVTCLGSSSVIWLSIPNVSGHNSIAITTSNGSGNLDIEYSNLGWPDSSNVQGSSSNAGNTECIYVTGGSNYWGSLKVSNSSGGASIVVDFDTAGCRQ